MADLALYLLGTVFVSGYLLNKNGKNPRNVEGERRNVPESEIPVGDNIYNSTRSKQVRDDVQRTSDKSYAKSKDPFNQNVIPPHFNVLGKIDPNTIGNRGGQKIGNMFIDETNGQISSTEINSSPMFNPLSPVVQESIKKANLGKGITGSFSNRIGGSPGGFGNSISGSPSNNVQGLSDANGYASTMNIPRSNDKVVANGFSVDDRKYDIGVPSKQEHFSNFTIHGPRNSNNPEFHNNMVPYFGGRGTQSLNPDANQTLLESFTGQTGGITEFRSVPKRETLNLYDASPNQSYVYGTPNDNISRDADRYVTSNLKTDILPTEQIKVGSGIGYGYDETPRDGFHSMYRPPTRNIDELRVNPKNTYEGRVLPGKELNSNRGIEGKTFKRRPDTFYINNPDRYLTTIGAHVAPQVREQFKAYTTNREKTSQEYTGIAGNGENMRDYAGVYLQGSNNCSNSVLGEIQHTKRNQFPNPSPRNSYMPGENHPDYDYGAESYVAYGQERATTEQPLGNQRLNVYSKEGTITQPYDNARTTTRQTLNVKDYQGISGANEGNRNQSTYYLDNAKTTTRQTLNVKDYQGISGATEGTRNPKSYNDAYNATNKNTQEILLKSRNYGPNKSTNITNSACDVNMQITSRIGYDITKYGQLPDKLYEQPIGLDQGYSNTTSQGNRDTTGIRQPENYLVKQFNANPFTQSLHSATSLTPQN